MSDEGEKITRYLSDDDTPEPGQAEDAQELEIDASQLPEALNTAIMEEDKFLLDNVLAHDGFSKELLDRADATGMTPLRKAARVGHPGIIARLLDSGATLTASDNVALFAAISWGNVEAISVMLDYQADPNCVQARNLDSPLIQACRGTDVIIVQLLVERKAEVNYGTGEDVPLKICWKDQKLEMVRFLVAQGSEVREAEWFNASESPNLCFNLAEGLRQRIEVYGNEGVPTISKAALLLWIDRAPKASATLFNDILVRKVTYNVPERAEMRTNISACYVPTTTFDKDVPAFKKMAPRDHGAGVSVDVSYINMGDLMTVDVLYGLSRAADASLLRSRGVEALLYSSWTHYVKSVYGFDVFTELIVLSTLVGWAITLPNERGSEATRGFRQSSIIVLGVVALREMFIESIVVRFFIFGKGYPPYSMRFWTNVNAVNWINITCTTFLIFQVLYHDETKPYSPNYLASMSISAFLRWVRMLDFITAYDRFGPAILPLIRSLSEIVTFSIVFFLMIFAFVHAMYVFEVVKYLCVKDCTGINPITPVEFLFKQFYLGMVTRWPVFMFELNPDNYFYVMELFWYAAGAFVVVIVMLQIFVGVMSEAYIDQRNMAKSIFMQTRANICFMYFLARMEPRKPKLNVHSVTRKVIWGPREVFGILKYRASYAVRLLAGSTRRPMDNGLLWLCARKEEKIAQSAGTAFDIWEHTAESHYSQLLKKCEEGQDALMGIVERVTHIQDLLDTLVSTVNDSQQQQQTLMSGCKHDLIRRRSSDVPDLPKMGLAQGGAARRSSVAWNL